MFEFQALWIGNYQIGFTMDPLHSSDSSSDEAGGWSDMDMDLKAFTDRRFERKMDKINPESGLSKSESEEFCAEQARARE